MRVSGFTIIRNGIKNNYPFIESIKSLLPLVDEFIINLSDEEKETYQEIIKLNDSKISIFKNKWDTEKSVKGSVRGGELANQTNIALSKCRGDWTFYLQADEVLHENDYDKIYNSMKRNLNNRNVKGLMFNYYHFYYSPNIVNYSMYKRQIRIIRNDGSVKSIKDACGFAYREGEIKDYKFWLWKHTGGWIYHYGWIYKPTIVEEKNKNKEIKFDFRLCEVFKGTHPKVMKDRIENSKITPVELPKLPFFLRPYYYRRKFKKIFRI